MKRVAAGLAIVLAAGLAGAFAVTLAADGGVDGGAAVVTGADGGQPGTSPIEQAVAAGRSWRIETPSGPVHVWAPAGYHADGAATVVYAHGYYIDSDSAWLEYRLPQQFALSSINALFIAPEVPSGSRQKVTWPSLSDLLVEVQRATGVARPMGTTVVIGHSGAYRELHAWMSYPGLDMIISMDAMYESLDLWQEWLDGSSARRLINVGDDTARWTEELARELGDQVLTLDRFPEDGVIPAEARTARVVYVRSQLGHWPLVTDGLGLPYVLRMVPAEILPDAPWHEPLGLPPIDAGPPDSVSKR